MDCCIFLYCRFKFHHHNRETVYIDDGIRPSCCFGALNGHLIYDFDDVLVILGIKIDQLKMEIL